MIIALSVAYDDGTFAVHYAGAKTLKQAHDWCEARKDEMRKQGTDCDSAILQTDHIHWIDDCGADDQAEAS